MAPPRSEKAEQAGRALWGGSSLCCQIFGHSLDAVLLTRPDGSILAANPAACRLFGRNEEELISLGRGGVVDESDPRLVPALEERARTGHARAELTFIRSDGTVFTGETSSAVFRDIDGNELTSMIIRDVTDRTTADTTIRLSEARFRTLLDSLANIAIQGYGPDGTIHYWNKANEAIYGYTAAEAIGRNLLDLIIPPEMRDEVRKAIRLAAETGEMPPAAELLLMGKGARRVPVISSHAVVRMPDREPELFCLDVDISRRKRAEKALLESEERFRLAMEASSDGLWDWDIESGTGYFSPGCYRMLGYEPDEFALTIPIWLDLIHPEDRDRTVMAKTDCIENRTASFAESFRMKQKNGQWTWVLGRGRAVRRNAGGRAVRMIGTHVDITERKSAELKLQRLNDELEQRVRERTCELESSISEMESFCHSVSHELRAPIARIEGFCHLLTECLDHEDPKGVRHCAERLGYSSQRIRAVVDALLSIHRLGRADMKLESVNLSDLARQTTDELAEQDPTRRLQFVIAPDIVAQGDRRMLGICLQNLLENAVKYTGKTAEPLIEFGVVESFGDTVYFVRDNGAGFDMAFANKLFQPFSRLHNDEEFTGSGVGLATVQRIVERHCGQIWAEASPGSGATFYFTLCTQ